MNEFENEVQNRLACAIVMGFPSENLTIYHNNEDVFGNYFASDYGFHQLKRVPALPKDGIVIMNSGYVPKCPMCGREHEVVEQ